MNDYTKELQGELNDSGKIPMFEIEVIDSDLAREWISCDVYFQGNSIVAERDAVREIMDGDLYDLALETV